MDDKMRRDETYHVEGGVMPPEYLHRRDQTHAEALDELRQSNNYILITGAKVSEDEIPEGTLGLDIHFIQNYELTAMELIEFLAMTVHTLGTQCNKIMADLGPEATAVFTAILMQMRMTDA